MHKYAQDGTRTRMLRKALGLKPNVSANSTTRALKKTTGFLAMGDI